MAGKYVQDMTEGKELPLLVKFSIPMIIGNIFQQFYNMVDSIIVGHYVGADALAAVGATGSLNFLFFSLCGGMSVGIGILVSQHFGAKEDDYVKKVIANTVYIMLGIGIIMSILGVVFARPILALLRTPAEIIDDSTIYMQIVCAGVLAVAGYNAISSILRALGDSKTPLIFLVVASIINVGLDLLFVMEFGLGVSGVAYATIIAQSVAAIGSIVFALIKNPYFKIEKEHRKFDKEIIQRSVRLGVPVAAQSAMIAMSCIALQAVVNGFGAVVVAAFTATSRIEQLVQQPFNSVGAAMSTFAGQNIGAKKIERVRSGYRKSISMIAGFSLAMLVVAWTCGKYIMKLFVDDAEVISLGITALKITSTMYFPLGMIYITRGLLNGSGDAFYAMINGVVELLGRVIFPVLLVMIPMIGVWGVWLATGFTWIIAALASIIRYRQGKWMYKSAVMRET
ncbi:MAG TPA: MATE family efflux transporter [Lachnospiraceae bacterium]|nr:MATE family efflux transporter [Lachnospiraceae bacterium]